MHHSVLLHRWANMNRMSPFLSQKEHQALRALFDWDLHADVFHFRRGKIGNWECGDPPWIHVWSDR